MKRIVTLSVLLVYGLLSQAQNMELRSGKDIFQPGKLNPALAGIQEDLIKVLSGLDANANYQLMVEGKLPFKLGNYMVGVEQISTSDVTNHVVDITYGRTVKGEKKSPFEFRYGGSLELNTKSFVHHTWDSTGYSFVDINGQVRTVPNLSDIESEINYINFEFGGSMAYNDLFLGFGIDNFVKQNVSLVKGDERNIPFSANLVLGGFINLGEETVIFPSAVAVLTKGERYAKLSANAAIKDLNLALNYTSESSVNNISASVGYRFKKSMVGLSYSHPLTDIDDLPRFQLYLNHSFIRGIQRFKSDFAKNMKLFY